MDSFDVAGFLERYESDPRGLTPRALAEGFGHLVRTGLAWELQGHYGRTAMHLIELGFIGTDGTVNEEHLADGRLHL